MGQQPVVSGNTQQDKKPPRVIRVKVASPHMYFLALYAFATRDTSMMAFACLFWLALSMTPPYTAAFRNDVFRLGRASQALYDDHENL